MKTKNKQLAEELKTEFEKLYPDEGTGYKAFELYANFKWSMITIIGMNVTDTAKEHKEWLDLLIK